MNKISHQHLFFFFRTPNVTDYGCLLQTRRRTSLEYKILDENSSKAFKWEISFSKILSNSLKINRWIHWEESNNYFPQFKLFKLTLWTESLDYCYYISRHSENLRNFPFQDTGTTALSFYIPHKIFWNSKSQWQTTNTHKKNF